MHYVIISMEDSLAYPQNDLAGWQFHVSHHMHTKLIVHTSKL